MHTISQNAEICVEHCPSTFIRRVVKGSCPCELAVGSCELDEEVVLVQRVENFKNFQAHFEVLHRLHPNPWTYVFWHLASHAAVSFRQ